MARFRKKPIEIEAWKVSDLLWSASNDWGSLPEPIRKAYEEPESCVVFEADKVFIRTLEGEMEGKKGDWIIRGVKGEFYPIKDEILQKTYEPVYAHDNDQSQRAGANDGKANTTTE